MRQCAKSYRDVLGILQGTIYLQSRQHKKFNNLAISRIKQISLLWESKVSVVINYPDSLVNMWQYTHNEAPSEFTGELCGQVWEKLEAVLAGSLKNNLPGIESYQDAKDAAQSFLVEMLKNACPYHIRNVSILVSNARKYLARKNNPVQYELNEILHEALNDLEKSGAIERDSASKNHRISNLTLFALAGTPNTKKSSLNDYENNKHIVGTFTTKLREGAPEHSRILTPTDARELVMQLLKAFGGWTNKAAIFKAMQNHIPDQMRIIPGVEIEDEDIVNKPAPEDNDYMDDFSMMQINRISGIASERIWERICKISNKVFCLYYLPKTIFEKDVKMEALGKTSTVSDQNRKITLIVQDEIGNYLKENDGYESAAIKKTVKKIFKNLCGTCTESGYNPGLYSRETEYKAKGN